MPIIIKAESSSRDARDREVSWLLTGLRRFLCRIFPFSNFYNLLSCSPSHAISKTAS